MINKIKNSNKGAVALLLVIMITALTIVSVVVVSMTNVNDLMSAYHFSEAEEADVDLDACLDDAMLRLASTTAASGTYYLTSVGTNCYYQISSTIVGGLKTVTTTASSTSSIGYWEDTVVAQINVSSTPISIYSYKNSDSSYTSYEYCGDAVCNGSETCSDCSADCGSCQVCGNGVQEGSEVCDDGNLITERCGNGVQEIGTYCNSSCTIEVTLNEACDSNLTGECSLPAGYYLNGYTHAAAACIESKSAGVACNATCTACTSFCASS